MNIKKTFLGVAVFSLLMGGSLVASAQTNVVYAFANVATKTIVGTFVNASAESQNVYVNVDLTSGIYGAYVSQNTTTGEELSEHFFPFQTNIPDWVVSVPAGVVRDFGVKPANKNYPISGNLILK